jgi:TPR repeat protein
MYIQGQSVATDLVEAYMWLDLAVKQDSREALKTRGLITKQLSPAEINEAEERVANWKPTVP